MQISASKRSKVMRSYPAPRSIELTMSGPDIGNGPGAAMQPGGTVCQ